METQAKPLPKWLMKRYAILWKTFGGNPFAFSEAAHALEENGRITSVFLCKMKKNGWIEPRIMQDDARKRVYTLRTPDDVITQIAMCMKNVETGTIDIAQPSG